MRVVRIATAIGLAIISPTTMLLAAAPQAYSVANVSPGMTEAQAKSAATSAGYSLGQAVPGFDFSQEVKRARTGAYLTEKGNGLASEIYRKGSESLEVTYVAMPSGPVVSVVSYNAPPGAIPGQSAVAEMVRRYGKPSKIDPRAPSGAESDWCALTPRGVCGGTEPQLSINASSSLTFIRAENNAIVAQQKSAILKAPGAPKASF